MRDNKITTELDKILQVAGEQNNAVISISPGIAGDAAGSDQSAASAGTALSDAIAQNTSQLIQVRGSLQGQLDSLMENTRALIENTTKSQGVGSKVGGVASSVATSILGGGILGPIVSGLLGLFGGGDEAESTPSLVKFALPQALRVEAGFNANAASPVDYGQNDKPRLAASAAPQITVNVNAMDSRSFLDHSTEIASAVRRAMLESNSLNDVIGEM